MKKIFLLVGESGCGKDTFANMLEQDGYKILKSYATRPKRENEGFTHVFIKPEEVEQYKNDMVAYTKIGEYEYFATKNQVLENDIYIIDPLGVQFLKDHHLNINIDIIVIYINVDRFERKERALKRGDVEENINKRFAAEDYQFQCFREQAEFNYSIENIDINKSYKILKHIIEGENNGNEKQNMSRMW
jgi:guanylate kinase